MWYAGLAIWAAGLEREPERGGRYRLYHPAQRPHRPVRYQPVRRFAFTKGEEGWTRDDDSDFPTDQDALDDLAGQAGKLAAVRTIADPEDLSSYGLNEPPWR